MCNKPNQHTVHFNNLFTDGIKSRHGASQLSKAWGKICVMFTDTCHTLWKKICQKRLCRVVDPDIIDNVQAPSEWLYSIAEDKPRKKLSKKMPISKLIWERYALLPLNPPRFRYLVLVADPLSGSESVQLAGSADLPKQSWELDFVYPLPALF